MLVTLRMVFAWALWQ